MNTFVKINLDLASKNVEEIVKKYPDYKYYIGVVKSDFYGHGIQIVNELIKGGINYLAVSYLDEALAIRKISSIPILCLQPISLNDIELAIANNITVTVHDFDYFEKLNKLEINNNLKIHLKIDSGMNRLGFKSELEIKTVVDEINNNEKLILEGIFTHFATSGLFDKHYDEQLNKFKKLTSLIDLSRIPIIHLGSSVIMVSHEKIPFATGIRMGILMYGYNISYIKNNKGIKNKIKNIRNSLLQRKISKTITNVDINLHPLMSMQTKIIQIKKVLKGEYIGYGAQYKASKDMIIAILPIGYANGIGHINNGRYVIINDKKYYAVGNIGMNMMAIEVDDKVNITDTVHILGNGITLGTLSRFEGIGIAETLINIGENNKRIYTK